MEYLNCSNVEEFTQVIAEIMNELAEEYKVLV